MYNGFFCFINLSVGPDEQFPLTDHQNVATHMDFDISTLPPPIPVLLQLQSTSSPFPPPPPDVLYSQSTSPLPPPPPDLLYSQSTSPSFPPPPPLELLDSQSTLPPPPLESQSITPQASTINPIDTVDSFTRVFDRFSDYDTMKQVCELNLRGELNAIQFKKISEEIYKDKTLRPYRKLLSLAALVHSELFLPSNGGTNTVFNRNDVQLQQLNPQHPTQVSFLQTDTVSAITGAAVMKTLVLNFANAYHAGGGYESGAQAQEESIIYRTDYANFLKAADYPFTNSDYNNEDQAVECNVILSEGVSILRDRDLAPMQGHVIADFLAVALYDMHDENSILQVIEESINGAVLSPESNDYIQKIYRKLEMIFLVGALQGYDRLILGAIGTGVFRNNIQIVAAIFCELCAEYHGRFHRIDFALFPNDIDTFQGIFKDPHTNARTLVRQALWGEDSNQPSNQTQNTSLPPPPALSESEQFALHHQFDIEKIPPPPPLSSVPPPPLSSVPTPPPPPPSTVPSSTVPSSTVPPRQSQPSAPKSDQARHTDHFATFTELMNQIKDRAFSLKKTAPLSKDPPEKSMTFSS